MIMASGDSKIHKFGLFSGNFFYRYSKFLQDRKNDPNWLKEQRKLEEEYAGYELDTPFQGMIKGAMEAVKEKCKKDPMVAAATAINVYRSSGVRKETVYDFTSGFVKGYISGKK